jgi:hypothetical protein
MGYDDVLAALDVEPIKKNVIMEETAGSGVTVDGTLLKDGGAKLTADLTVYSGTDLKAQITASSGDVSTVGNVNAETSVNVGAAGASTISLVGSTGEITCTSIVGGLTGDITGNITGNVSGNIGGSVGSVTGGVGGDVGGNVTGNVGGNVVGDVGGAVTGSVGSVSGSVTGSVGGVVGDVGGDVTGSVGSVTGGVGGDVGGNVTGNVGGNVTGSVGSVTGGVGGDVGGNVTGNVTGTVGGLTASTAIEVTGIPVYDAESDWTCAGYSSLGSSKTAEIMYYGFQTATGEVISKFRVQGTATIAGASTLDADLVKVTGAGSVSTLGSITQVTENGEFDQTITLGAAETCGANTFYAIKLTGTTAAGDSLIVGSTSVAIKRKA